MPRKKKALKSVKKAENTPKILSIGEALEAENLSNKILLLRKDTELFKAKIDVATLRLRAFEQEVLIQRNNVDSVKRDLKSHGEGVMTAEKRYQSFKDRLCEKYGVSKLSYNQDTLEISED